MNPVSSGDLHQAYQLRRDAARLKAETAQLGTEVATGLKSDTAQAVAGDFTVLAGIESSLARNRGHALVASEAGVLLSGIQAVLERIDTTAGDLSTGLQQAASSGHAQMIGTIGASAAQQLDSVVSALNTRLGDRTLLAGTATGGPALIDAGDMLDALVATVAGATTAEDVSARVADWFDDAGGFAATAWQGSNTTRLMPVGPGETLRIDITANDPSVRDTLKGLAMAALLDHGVLAGTPSARTELAQLAGLSLAESATARADLAARVGDTEARVDNARQRTTAETAALELARAGILGADPYETASRLEAAQSQLETLHAVTARLSRLSLVDFL